MTSDVIYTLQYNTERFSLLYLVIVNNFDFKIYTILVTVVALLHNFERLNFDAHKLIAFNILTNAFWLLRFDLMLKLRSRLKEKKENRVKPANYLNFQRIFHEIRIRETGTTYALCIQTKLALVAVSNFVEN